MGHYKKVRGKLVYAPTCFKEASTAMQSLKPGDLEPGQVVSMSGKNHTYLGMTNHDGDSETHHFQQNSNSDYKSYPTNSVPPMQSRDVMENGDNDAAATSDQD